MYGVVLLFKVCKERCCIILYIVKVKVLISISRL